MRLPKMLLVLFVCAATPVSAGPSEDAYAAYSRGDYATALRLWRPLADQGNAYAQTQLGVMYELGRGVPKGNATAAAWYRKAAEQGYAIGQANLGHMYEEGLGVPRDYVQAYKWWSLAASRFSASQSSRRDTVIKSRDALAAKMTSAQIAEAQKLAREWKPNRRG